MFYPYGNADRPCPAGAVEAKASQLEDTMTSTHDFTATTAEGDKVPLSDYEGKLLLIVNVASKCGLTPQYEGLEALYRDDKDRGLEILGFPSNQFKEQEPGTDAEIQEF
jgi:glutathione peroxidase